jgi:solute carrier family 50 protein (sugar transporter)
MVVQSLILSNVLKVAGPAFFLGLQSSSVNTAVSIFAQKSVGKLSPVPFISLFTNCVIWTYYGLLKKDNTVLIPNVIGCFAGAGCVLTYQKFTQESPISLYIGSFLILAISTYLALQGNWKILGSIGCALAVAVSGSPLATVGTVLKDKSTAALPFLTSFTTWMNAFSWSLYGILIANDPMIYGPNLLGLALASIQMSLFVLFGLPPPVIATKTKAMF